MSRSRDGWAISADLAALAFVLRLGVIVYALAEPVWDGHYYDVGARRIAAGLGYSEDLFIAGAGGIERAVWHPWAHYPVGYSGFLALFFKIFGGGLAVGPLANALTGAALAVVVHRLALHLHAGLSDRERAVRAAIAGVLVAAHPGLVLYAGALMTEPLAALGMLAAILAIVAAPPRPKPALVAAAIAGVLLGLTTLVRPNAILLAPFLPLLAPRAAIPQRALARIGGLVARGALVGGLALGTVMPWTLRNCRVMDQCALVSTNAGWNLVIGAAPGATGKFEFLVGHTPEGAPTCAEGGQVAQDRCWFAYGASIIKRDFRRWLSLVPAKLHYTLDAEWFPINYLREARPDVISAGTHVVVGKALTVLQHALLFAAALAALGRPGTSARESRRAGGRALQLVLFAALVALAVFGFQNAAAWPLGVAACILPLLPLPGAPERSSTEIAVALAIVTTLATHAIFFGEDRYHLAITPAFALLAAGIGRRSAPV
jgi:hypothetical protein